MVLENNSTIRIEGTGGDTFAGGFEPTHPFMPTDVGNAVYRREGEDGLPEGLYAIVSVTNGEAELAPICTKEGVHLWR